MKAKQEQLVKPATAVGNSREQACYSLVLQACICLGTLKVCMFVMSKKL